jgi:hypothetical protein
MDARSITEMPGRVQLSGITWMLVDAGLSYP